MSRSSRSILFALTAALFGGMTTPAETGQPVRIPGGELPMEVTKLGDLTGLTAFAIADDGTTAAGAFPGEKPGRSVLRISRGAGTGDSPTEIAIRGRVRSLRFSRDGADVYAIAARDGKRENGDAFLLRITVATREMSREFVLPRGATDVDWIDATTLIVASSNELRTFSVPSLTSGPLYRLDGSNRALAAIPGTRRILAAGDDGIVLVELDDPQSRDGLPARDKLPMSTPVIALAIAPDGREALARHEDGHVDRFSVEPLGGTVADGQAVAIAWPGPRQDAPPPAPRPQAAAKVPTEPEPAPQAATKEPQLAPAVAAPAKSTTPSPPEVQATPPAPQEMKPPATEPGAAPRSAAESSASQAQSTTTPPLGPPAVPPESAGPSNRESQGALPPPAPPSQTQAAPSHPSQPPVLQQESAATPPPQPLPQQTAPTPPPQTPPPAPAPQPEPTPSPEPAAPPKVEAAPDADTSAADRVEVRGAVTGAAAASIAAVVILGPNNLLREAARVKPSADGTWSVTDLAPGTYRIQLDAGSGRAVEANPAFRTIRIERNGTTQVAPIEARRLL